MVKNPRITVATLVEQDNRFLVVEEVSDNQTVFNQPAGHVEEGEDLIQAALRETLEETTWEIEITGFLGVYVLPVPEKDFTYYRFCFTAKPLAKTTKPLDKDIIAAHWMTPEEIRQKESQLRSPLVLQCVNDYLSGRRYPLDLIRESRDRGD